MTEQSTYQVILWDFALGQERTCAGKYADSRPCRAFAADHQPLAVCEDRRIDLYDTATGQVHRTLEGRGKPVEMAFAPDGKILAVGYDDDETVSLWDVVTGRRLWTIRDSVGGKNLMGRGHLAFDPSGRRLAVTGAAGTLSVCDVASGDVLRRIPAHDSEVRQVALTPDSQRIISAGGSAGQPLEVKIWDAETGLELLTLRSGLALPLPGDVVLVSPDGRRLVVQASNEVQIWDASPGDEEPD